MYSIHIDKNDSNEKYTFSLTNSIKNINVGEYNNPINGLNSAIEYLQTLNKDIQFDTCSQTYLSIKKNMDNEGYYSTSVFLDETYVAKFHTSNIIFNVFNDPNEAYNNSTKILKKLNIFHGKWSKPVDNFTDDNQFKLKTTKKIDYKKLMNNYKLPSKSKKEKDISIISQGLGGGEFAKIQHI